MLVEDNMYTTEYKNVKIWKIDCEFGENIIL